MARSLTGLPWSGFDLERFQPLLPVTPEAWAELGAGVNLALGVCGAAPVVSDGWADRQGQCDAEIWATVLTYDLPPAPSPRHTLLRVTVWGHSPDDTGRLRVRETTAGVWQVFELPVAYGAVTHDVALAAVDAPGLLEIQAEGFVWLRAVEVEVNAWLPAGWPDAGEHVEGPVVSPDIVPVELTELATDECVGARVVTDMRSALEHCRLRQRAYLNAASPRLAPAGEGGEGIRGRPLRGAAPVPFDNTTLTIRARAAGGAADGTIWVQHGRGNSRAVVDERIRADVVGIPVPAGAPEQAFDVSRLFRASRQIDAPARYPGFSHLAVWATPEVTLWSVSAWGR